MFQVKKEIIIGLIISLILGLITVRFAFSYSSRVTQIPIVDNNSEAISDEVVKHSDETDCWIIVDGQVLDVTRLLSIHPGGTGAITPYCGKDATAAFNEVGHSNKAVGMIANYAVGLFGQIVTTDALTPQASTAPTIDITDDDGEEEEDD